jgi:MFS family permease
MSAAADSRAPPRGFVFWLSVGQLVSWGTLFYTFSLLLVHFERDLALTRVDAALAFSLALGVEGALAFMVGRLIDGGRARSVMSLGSLAGGAAFVLISLASSRTGLYAGWMLAGAAMAGTLYAPAFAVLIHRYPDSYRRAIITLTFLGGLASTVFIPLGDWLIDRFGWRHALWVLAGLHWGIVLPIHLYWLRGEPRGGVQGATAHMPLAGHVRTLPFWGLAAFFVLFSGVTAAVAAHLVPILREAGLPEFWVIAIPASIGLLQVAGRLVLFLTERHIDVHRANRWIPTLLPVALMLLVLGVHSVPLAILYALCYGMANGMITIVKATAMAQYVSRERAASLNGLLGLPSSLARAAAPSLVASLWLIGGSYRLGLATLTALATFAVLAFWIAQRRALSA